MQRSPSLLERDYKGRFSVSSLLFTTLLAVSVFPASALGQGEDYDYINPGPSGAGWHQTGFFSPSSEPGAEDNLTLIGNGTTVGALNLGATNRAVANLYAPISGAIIAASASASTSLTIHEDLTVEVGASLSFYNGSATTTDIIILGNAILSGDLSLGSKNSARALKSFSVAGTTTVSAAVYNRFSNSSGIDFGDLAIQSTGSVTLMYKGNYSAGAEPEHLEATVKARSLSGNGSVIGSDIGTIGTRTATLAVQTEATTKATFAGQLQDGSSGSKLNVEISGDGRQILSGSHGYSGTTTVAGATLELAGSGQINTSSTLTLKDGATLIHNSATALSVPLTITHGTIGGSGTIEGDIVVGANATLSPGNSPGSQTFEGNQSWEAGGNYNWQIYDATGTAGTGFDTLTVTGTLDLSSLTPDHQFNLNLWSLSGITPDVNGEALNFDANLTQQWLIATAGNLLYNSSYDINELFTIHLDAYNGANGLMNAASGHWSVVENDHQLFLRYEAIPEPQTFLLLLPAGLLLFFLRNRSAIVASCTR